MAHVRKNLGDILIEERILSLEELDGVLARAKARNLSLEETLFKLGYVSRDALGHLLAKLHGCEFMDLRSRTIESNALAAISADMALELQVLPYGFEGDTLQVACAGPSEKRSLAEIVTHLEQVSGKKVRVALCNPDALKEMLARLSEPQPDSHRSGAPVQGELSFAVQSLKADRFDTQLRAQFEDIYDVGQNALIGANSHPFSNAVETTIEEAHAKLVESKKYADSAFLEEAVEIARQAVSLLREATAEADSFEKEWEKLLQQVKKLGARVDSLEQTGTAEYLPAEFNKLTRIRDELQRCVESRDAETLRSLLDQGAGISERISLQQPDSEKRHEQLITTLAKVRDIVVHAQNSGAEELAPDIMREARELMEEAEDFARHGQWDNVGDYLTSAESKALEAERVALQVAQENERRTIKLREAARAAISVFEKAVAHPFACEVTEELVQARDAINECKKCFESTQLEHGIELAQTLARRLRDEIIPRADRAEREWNELAGRIDAVTARRQSIDTAVALRVAPKELRLLLQSERDIAVLLCDRNREKLAETITTYEGLVEKMGETTAAAKQSLQQAETSISDAISTLTSAAAYIIDKHTSSLYADARRMIKGARGFLEDGEIDTALRLAQDARTKLETEIIQPQEALRQEWEELCSRSKTVSEHIKTIDKPTALTVAPEKIELLLQHEHDMVSSIIERNREQLASSLFACEELVKEIQKDTAQKGKSYQEAETAIADIRQAIAAAAAPGIDDYSASAYRESLLLADQARQSLKGGDSAAALEHARAARRKLETDVSRRQESVRNEWRDLISRSSMLLGKIHEIGSTDAAYYCPELVEKLHSGAFYIFSAVADRNTDRAKSSIADVRKTLESVEGAIEVAKSEHLRQLFEQVAEIEDAIQDAVQTCGGNYSADMLEIAYLDLNRIKEQLAEGPEALDAKREDTLKSELALARTKLWQVEFLRERFEREREETLRQLKLKMDSAREAIEACTNLDFIGESTALLERAGALLAQVDNLLIEGDIEESFEVIRQSDALTGEILGIAEERESQWKSLAASLTAGDAPHRTALSDPLAEALAGKEHAKVAEMTKQTQSIIDKKDLPALQHHGNLLREQTNALAASLHKAKQRERSRIEQKVQDAIHEIRLAETLGGHGVCADIIDTARTYMDVAQKYLENDDFAGADSAADNALAKARDACSLAKSVSERTKLLFFDYLKIASAHIEQKNFEGAKKAIKQGLAAAADADHVAEKKADGPKT